MLGVPAELGLTEVLTKLGTQLDVMEPDGPNLVVVLTDLSFSTDPEKQLRASVSLPSDSPLSWLRVDLERLLVGFAQRVAELREDAEDLEAAEEAKSEDDNDSTNSYSKGS